MHGAEGSHGAPIFYSTRNMIGLIFVIHRFDFVIHPRSLWRKLGVGGCRGKWIIFHVDNYGGSAMVENDDVINCLCDSSDLCSPFLWIVYDFHGWTIFFSG